MATFPLHASMQYFGLILFSILFLILNLKKLKLPLTILFGYSLISAITLALSPWGSYLYIPQGIVEKTMYSCTQTALMMVLLPIVIMKVPSLFIRIMVTCWAIATILFIWTHGFGFENGYTFTSAILVCAIPIVPMILWPAIVITAIWFAGATTMGCLVIVLVSLYWKDLWQFKWYALPAGLLTFLATDKLLDGGGLHSSNGRFGAWGAFFDMWWDHFPHWLGTGVGSWEWIGPFIKNPTNQAFQWVHNDFLQMLFEGGIIGFVLLVIATLWVLFHVWSDTKTRSLALGLLVSMMTYYPMHFISSIVMILYVCKKAMEHSGFAVRHCQWKEITRRMPL